MSFWVLGSAGKKGEESGLEPKVKSGCQLSKKRNKSVAQTAAKPAASGGCWERQESRPTPGAKR